MTDSPQPTSPATSPALALPNEVWLAIFRRKELSYFDLKRLSRVCKRFHGFEQSKSLDDLLFRSPPPPLGLHKDTPVVFHPALDKANLVCTTPAEATVFLTRPNGTGKDGADFEAVPIVDYPCADEYATSPAATKVSFYAGGKPIIQNKAGVMVRDVVHRAAKMWSSTPPPEVLLSVDLEGFVGEGETPNWRHTLGEHCFWEGMDKAKTIQNNWVRLIPRWFGS
ncbi:hypothetical protein JCM8097_000345 [Rhodosporidiobolus ruineniae]